MFAADAAAFEAALDALPGIPAVVSAGHRDGAEHLSVLMNTNPGEAVRTAFANLSPDGTAKILFTSGSTGAPKGVLNAHRMLAANQQMIRQAWPFLGWERPVIVDWLPWSHTFGGNHNLNMMISSGGTLHVDAGRPAPALFGQTIRNLTDVPPTILGRHRDRTSGDQRAPPVHRRPLHRRAAAGRAGQAGTRRR